MNTILLLVLFFGSLGLLVFFVVRLTAWDFGSWQSAYRCKNCGHIAMYPYAGEGGACRKCGNKEWAPMAVKVKFFGGYRVKTSNQNETRGES